MNGTALLVIVGLAAFAGLCFLLDYVGKKPIKAPWRKPAEVHIYHLTARTIADMDKLAREFKDGSREPG